MNNKDKKVLNEEKALPPHLLSRLIGKKAEEVEEKIPENHTESLDANLEISQNEILENEENVEQTSEIETTISGIPKQPNTKSTNKKEKSEPPKQMNISISRQHFRDAQRLLTDVKLFADEKLNKNVSNGNLMEILIEIGKELYDKDPKKFEAKILGFFRK